MKSIQLAIYLAIRYNEHEIVNILIKTIDINIPLETGTTLLEEAIRYRRPLIVKHLLDHGAIKSSSILDFWFLQFRNDILTNQFINEHIEINKLLLDDLHQHIPNRSISSPF
jgi:hypothetical protein